LSRSFAQLTLGTRRGPEVNGGRVEAESHGIGKFIAIVFVVVFLVNNSGVKKALTNFSPFGKSVTKRRKSISVTCQDTPISAMIKMVINRLRTTRIVGSRVCTLHQPLSYFCTDVVEGDNNNSNSNENRAHATHVIDPDEFYQKKAESTTSH
jgi:hypothetical protein